MLGALYIAAIGSGIVYMGITFASVYELNIFSGCLIASFFWVSYPNVVIMENLFAVLLIFIPQEYLGGRLGLSTL